MAERLGLKLSKEEVEQAKVDKVIVDQIRDTCTQLKQCRNEVSYRPRLEPPQAATPNLEPTQAATPCASSRPRPATLSLEPPQAATLSLEPAQAATLCHEPPQAGNPEPRAAPGCNLEPRAAPGCNPEPRASPGCNPVPSSPPRLQPCALLARPGCNPVPRHPRPATLSLEQPCLLNPTPACPQEERVDLGVVLGAASPPRVLAGDSSGMISKIAKRLSVQRGSRYVKATGERRPRAFDQAITRRTEFDSRRLQALGPGAAATSRGRPCTVVKIDWEKDTCTLLFKSGCVEVTRDYTCIYKVEGSNGKLKYPKDSARLRSAPPSLRPQVTPTPKPLPCPYNSDLFCLLWCQTRATRSDEKLEAARPKVEELYDKEGARSPSQRDEV